MDFQLSRARDLDLVLGHTAYDTVVHHSSTSTYMPNFIEIKETFCGQMDLRTDKHLTLIKTFLLITFPLTLLRDI